MPRRSANVTAKLRIQIAPASECERLGPRTARGSVLGAGAGEPGAGVHFLRRQVPIDPRPAVVHRPRGRRQHHPASRGSRRADRAVQRDGALHAEKDRRTTLAKFQEDIKKSLGESFGEFVTATEDQDKAGRLVDRALATGKVSDLPVEWIYYLVQDAEGRRTSVVFTLSKAWRKNLPRRSSTGGVAEHALAAERFGQQTDSQFGRNCGLRNRPPGPAPGQHRRYAPDAVPSGGRARAAAV